MNNDKYPQFTVRLSDKSNQQLKNLALLRSRSRSEIVREAIYYYSRLYSAKIYTDELWIANPRPRLNADEL